MRTVLMVLFDQVQSLDVTGPLEVFAGANTWRTQDGDGAAYDIRTASLGGEMVRTSSGLRITPDEDLRHFGLPRWPADPAAARLRLALDELGRFGATPVGERVVFDGKYVTAAGVSAGIDMGLALAGRIAGDEVAQAIQLMIEYDPQPPYDAGSPDRAPAGIVRGMRARSRFLLTGRPG